MKYSNRLIAVLPLLSTSALAHSGTASHMHVSSNVSIPLASLAIAAATGLAWLAISVVKTRRSERHPQKIRD